MKKVILFFVLMFSIAYPQGMVKQNVNTVGLFASDSLFTTYIDTSATPDDTLAAAQEFVTIQLDYNYEWITIVVTDTGATYTDTTLVYFGVLTYTPVGTGSNFSISDTTWYPVHFIKDSSWTTVTQPIIGSQYYMIFCGNYWIMKIERTNVEAVLNRTTYIDIQAARKR